MQNLTHDAPPGGCGEQRSVEQRLEKVIGAECHLNDYRAVAKRACC